MHALAVLLVVLHGVVFRGPTKPVCSMVEPCDEPAAHVQLLFVQNGHVTRAQTDGHGRYSVRLRRGSYVVRVPRIQPATVFVRRAARADFFIDTGIR